MCSQKEDDETRLCWFCGTWQRSSEIQAGHSLAAVAFSADFPWRFDDPDAGYLSHWSQDRSQICNLCVRALYSQCESPTVEYLEVVERAREAVIGELLDYETELLELDERRHEFGCWFDHLPLTSIRVEFRSLTFSELFARGWRLHGSVELTVPVIRRMNDRFGRKACEEESAAFVQHCGEHIRTDEPSCLKELETVQAVISDAAVIDMAQNL